MKKHVLFKLFTLTFGLLMWSSVGWGQIISQYIETSTGTTPKGIEIWNNTGSSIDFSTTNLSIWKGINGAVPSEDVTISTGTLADGGVIVIGTDADVSGSGTGFKDFVEGNGATFYSYSFTFNGDDALEVYLDGVKTDVFGDPGTGDPGTGWAGNGVQTYNQNISLKSGITTGDTVGWTDPSIRFETTTTDNSLTGFGVAPESQSTDTPDWYNLQWPGSRTIDFNDTITVYAQVYETGVTDAAGQGAGIEAWIGVSPEDTDPATWATWIVATFNTDAGNNDEYMADIGSNLAPGTYYYASRFSLNSGPYVYGGFDGGPWDGTNNVSGVLTVNPPSTSLPYEETFDTDLGDCFVYSVAGTNPWEYNSGAAYANGYNGENPEEHWLILPAIDFDSYVEEVMNFTTFAQHGTIDANNYLKLFYSTDYPGTGDPTGYTWTELTFDLPASVGSTEIETPSGDIDLTGITGTEVYLAFKYHSTDAPTAWKVDDINIYEKQPPTTLAITSVEPVSPIAGQTFDITIESQDDSQIASEVDQDTEVELLLASGTGTLSGTLTGTIANGTSSVTITGLTYDVVETIEVKAAVTTGMTLTASANQSIEIREAPVVELPYLRDFETGDINTDGWSTQLLTGDLDWFIDEFSGNHFAKMSNYSGGNQPSETWLITPGIDLSTAVSPVFSFMNACNFDGADIEVKISTDYDGFSDTSTATWTDLSPTLSTGGYDNVSSGDLDLSAYTGGTAYIAFKYTGTDSDGKTWQIDDVSIALSDDATLSTFTLGGVDVTGLTGLEVADTINDAGAILYVDDFSSFEGIDIVPNDAGATAQVTLNGSLVDPGNYATQALADGDVVVATVEAEDGTMAYYKVTLTSENRELVITGPALPATYQTGEDMTFTWTAANIANVNIYAVDTEGANLINEEGVIDATLGTYTYTIANGDFGTFTIRITNASDETFYAETTDEITINDIQNPAGVEFYPEMGATDVPVDFTLYVLFDEEVVAGTGNFTIYDASDDSEVLSFTAADFTINEEISTVEVTGLDFETQYYILADEGIIEDLSGNAISALNDHTTWTFTTMVEPDYELFFSEYIEGSSNNKAIEIYNPGNTEVDLTPYVVKLASNGGDWGNTLDLTGTLGSGEVYIIANSGAVQEILDLADVTSDVTYYNGNDALGLFKNDALIDAIGIQGEDPNNNDDGTFWDVAGIANATAEHTLVRKTGIYSGNINWTESAGTNEENSEWMVYDQDYFDNLGIHSTMPSSEAEILDFTFGPAIDYEDAVINSELATVNITVINGTVVTALAPTIIVSDGATIDPASGTVVDFTDPYMYTVTAQDSTVKYWTVTVTELPTLSDKANILEVQLAGVDSININETDTTVTIYAPYGFDVASVKPEFTVSAGASIADTAAARDFTDPQVYEVTAQDGSTIKNWEVAIIINEPMELTIYDIQYTEDASGASPYEDEIVKTSGIVTGVGGDGFFMQANDEEWNGIYVYAPDGNTATLGDSAWVVGTVDEYQNGTQISYVKDYIVIEQDVTLPDPIEITDLANTLTESHEGMLVKLINIECTDGPSSYNEWTFTDESGDQIMVDDILGYQHTFTIGAKYSITGLRQTYFGDKITPRNDNDIVDVTTGISTPDGIVSINVYPNPSNGQFIFEMNASKAGTFNVEIINIQGQVVYQKQITQDGFYRESIDISDKARGMYYIRLNDGQSMKIAKIMIQ